MLSNFGLKLIDREKDVTTMLNLNFIFSATSLILRFFVVTSKNLGFNTTSVYVANLIQGYAATKIQ